MNKRQVFTPEFIRYLRELVGWWRSSQSEKKSSDFITQAGGITFTNDSGEDIPPYACMHVTGTETLDGRNYVIVDKPGASDVGPYIFNGPYECLDGDQGTAQSGPYYRALVVEGEAGDYDAGNTARPTDGEWYLTKGGGFVVTGVDELEDDLVRVWVPHEGELFRFELQESIENGDGGETGPTTIIKNFPKTLTHTSEAVLINVDGMIDDFGDGAVGICKYESGKYWFVQAKCGQTCEHTSSVPLQTPTTATIGSTSYTWTPTSSGTINSWAQSGKPADFSFNTSTGALTGPTGSPGVAGPARTVSIALTATVPKTGGGTCTITRVVLLRIQA